MDSQNRARFNITEEEFQKGALLTNKTKPAEIFRELLNLAEQATEREPTGHTDLKTLGRIDSIENQLSKGVLESKGERAYWDNRLMKAKTLTAELHLAREIAKMDKKELELVIESPKRLAELPESFDEARCYKCHKRGHYPSQCPEGS